MTNTDRRPASLQAESEITFPQNLEAERALLGTVLVDNAVLTTTLEMIGKDDFFTESHRLIFEKMAQLSDKSVPIDLVTLSEELARAGLLERVGGAAYIASLTDGVPFGAGINGMEYCRIIKGKAVLRKILNSTNSLQQEVLSGVGEPEDVIAAFQREATEISAENQDTIGRAKSIHEIIGVTLPKLQIAAEGGLTVGTPTGFQSIDRITAGWMPGDLVVIAARPSLGKTSLAMDFLLASAHRGNPGGMFSLEMTDMALVLRSLCGTAGVSHHAIKTGKATKEEWIRLVRAASELAGLPIWIDDRPSVKAEVLRHRIRSIGQRHGAKLVVVDYLQLVTVKAENATQEVSMVARELKAAAKELGKLTGGTLIAVSQLSRIRNDEEPQLFHLRQSGQIEQDADVVIFIWDEPTTGEQSRSNPHPKNLNVAKQRNGPCERFRLMYFPEWTTFKEMSTEPEQDEPPSAPYDWKTAASGVEMEQ